MDTPPAEESPATRVELIGSPRLVTASGVVHRLERRDAALLALAVIKRDVSREHAARLLWPDAALKNAQSSLRQRLFRLHRTAGTHVLEGGSSLLGLGAGVAHDLADFALRLPADSAAASGELLDGLRYDDLEEFDRWLAGAREQWRLDRRRLLAQVAEGLEADGRIAQALPYAERLVAEDALAEHAHRRVIRLHYRRGDRSAALAAFERCRTVLADEVGAAPATETRELMRLVERSEPAQASPAAPPTPVALLRPPRLVGRQGEWLAIERAWARGRTVLLRGEAGIGKTRLAGDFAAARQGVPVCRARPGDTTLPYAVLARLLRLLIESFGPPQAPWVCRALAPLVPELGAVVQPAAEPLRLRQALLQALADWAIQAPAAGGGTAAAWAGLVIDDLQFADADSLAVLLAWLATDPMPCCLLTVRAAEVPAALADWVAAQERDRLVELALPPLDRAGIAELLVSLQVPGLDAPRWVEPLLRHTGGNPMFVMETLIALLDRGEAGQAPGEAPLPAPQSIGRLIEQRLDALPAPALRLARVAGLAGTDFDAELAAAVLGVHVLDLAADWAALEAAQVLRDGAFAHDLILEAALRQVPEPIARIIHRDIAHELLRRERPAARIAEQGWAAHEWPLAAVQFERAADAAAALGRRDEQRRLLERAALCHDHAGQAPQAFAARLRAAEAMIAVGSLAEATQQLEALDRQAVDGPQRLAVRLRQAEAALTAYDAGAGRTAAEAALETAQLLGDAQSEFDAARLLGSALALQGQATQALELLQARSGFVDGLISPRSRCAFHGTLGYVLVMADRRREAMSHLHKAVEIAEQIGDLPDALTQLTNLAGTLSLLGRVDEALALAERAGRLRLRMGESEGVGVGMNQNMIGLACTVLGRYSRALVAFEAGLAGLRAAGAAMGIIAAEGLLANLYLTLGQRARARQALGAVPAGMRAAQVARRLVIEARIERAAGSSGLDKLHQAVALFDGGGLAPERLAAQLSLAAALEPGDALPLCRDIAQQAQDKELAAIGLTALVREAEMLTRLGRGTEAAAVARVLIGRIDACVPHDLYRGEFWWLVFKAFDAAGQTSAADAALRRGAGWVNEALPNVPEPFRDSFLQRNAVNRQLLAMAGRRQA